MQTRRLSKRLNLNSTSVEGDEEHPSTSQSDSGAPKTTFDLTLPEDLDVDTLQTILPDFTLSKPSPDSILDLYRTIQRQASQLDEVTQERDAALSNVSRYEVELDQALQDQDVQTTQLRSALEEVQSELAEVKRQKEELELARASLQQQVTTLTTTHSSSSTETDELRRQISVVQSEKRDLLGVVETLRDELSQRDGESMKLNDLASLRATTKQLRGENGTLQNQLADSRSSETSSKFRLQSLEQELELVRSENQRNSAEVNTLQETSSNDRRAKHAEIVRLQAQVDALAQDKSSAESRLEALKKANRAQENQLEEALTRITNLQGELSQQTSSFRAESETQKRLTELMDRRYEDSRRRLEEIEQEWDGVLAKASETEARLKEELAKERERGDDLENRLDELRLVTDTMRPPEFGTPGVGRSSTPIPGTPGSAGSTSFFLSPAANLAIKLQKGGRSYTEVYADFVKTSEELNAQKEETRRLESALAQILTDIEERAPLIRSQQIEYSRLQEESSSLATQLAQISSERDSLAVAAKEASSASRKAQEENTIFQKQLVDLGRQVQGLLREISIRDEPSLEHIDFDDAAPVEDNDSDEVISDNLVLFKTLPQLQAQNMRLLKISRGLARQLEAKESDIESRLRGEESEALAEASEAVRDMEAELQRQKVIVASLTKERDMYRSMVARQSTGELLSNGNGRPSSGNTHLPADNDNGQMLQEQQSLFETFKTEMGVDTQKLKSDLVAAQRERDQNIIALSKANAQIEYLQERIRLSQTTADLQTQELSSLQKRNQSLQDSLSKTEISAYHVSEELREARTLSERLRQESANMQAENTFLKTVEARLHEDNRSLMKERSQMQELMGNLTMIHAELEKSGDTEKRRLERQTKTLENQLQDVRDQVVRDSEAARHALLQKDSEIRELRDRLDATTQDLHKSREAQSVAEASKSHLETRAEDLRRQLESVTEKLSVYERLPAGGAPEARANGVSEETILRAEVAELRATLKAAETDLATSRGHAEQYRSISEANEAALESLNATYEQYKADTERELRARSTELTAKTERLDVLQQDLATAHREQMELAQQLETARAEFEADKRMLEATIADLSTVEDRALSTQASVQEDLRRQAQIAQDAHDKYSRELVAHAEAVKENTRLKEELLQAQAKARDCEAAAEAANAIAANADSKWAAQRDSLKKEFEDVSSRCMDLVAQNATLHQHLESVSSQAARIRQAAEAPQTDASVAGTTEAGDDDAAAELRGVIAFVRREKEIAELQLDLHKQENVRLKAYSDRLNQTLEDTRKLLTEERERASRSVVSADQHAELLEKIQQLNLLRESNSTLRLDSEANLKAAQELQTQLRAARQELDPIRERVRVLEAEVETRQGLIHRLEEDNKRLKDRTEQILSKHHRVDPEELQTLKDQVEALTKERDDKIAEAERMRAAAASNKSAHEKLLNETRLQFGRMNGELSQARSERDSARSQLQQATSQQTADQSASSQQLAAAQARLAALDASLAQARQEAEEAKRSLAAQGVSGDASSEQLTALQAELDNIKAQKQSVEEQLAAAQSLLESEKASLEEQLQRLKKRDDRLLEDNKKFIREKRALEVKVKELEEASQAAQAQQAAQTEADAAAQPPDVQELIARRVAEVTAEHEAALAAAVEEARKEAEAQSATKSTADVEARHSEELKALEARLAEQHRAELQAAVAAASESVAKEAAAIASSTDSPGIPTGEGGAPPLSENIEAIVEDRVANAKALWEAEQATLVSELRAKVEAELAEKQTQAVNTAKENVQKELQMKMQLKDNLLAKARKELADAKEKIEALNNGGATASSGPSTRLSAAASIGGPSSSTAPAAAGRGAGRGTPVAARGAAAGRGRGTRGGATGGGVALGRGGSQILQAVAEQTGGAAPASPSTAKPAGQPPTSILGAAGAKRPRESDADAPTAETPKRARGGAPSIVRPTRGTPAANSPKPSAPPS